ncbi:hypothetical protein HK104_009849 [Borealophlyctis nickersoniae]|nr:hypothetical protein HK104_009849 [Borealophlyctis nickersoniae]
MRFTCSAEGESMNMSEQQGHLLTCHDIVFGDLTPIDVAKVLDFEEFGEYQVPWTPQEKRPSVVRRRSIVFGTIVSSGIVAPDALLLPTGSKASDSTSTIARPHNEKRKLSLAESDKPVSFEIARRRSSVTSGAGDSTSDSKSEARPQAKKPASEESKKDEGVLEVQARNDSAVKDTLAGGPNGLPCVVSPASHVPNGPIVKDKGPVTKAKDKGPVTKAKEISEPRPELVTASSPASHAPNGPVVKDTGPVTKAKEKGPVTKAKEISEPRPELVTAAPSSGELPMGDEFADYLLITLWSAGTDANVDKAGRDTVAAPVLPKNPPKQPAAVVSPASSPRSPMSYASVISPRLAANGNAAADNAAGTSVSATAPTKSVSPKTKASKEKPPKSQPSESKSSPAKAPPSAEVNSASVKSPKNAQGGQPAAALSSPVPKTNGVSTNGVGSYSPSVASTISSSVPPPLTLGKSAQSLSPSSSPPTSPVKPAFSWAAVVKSNSTGQASPPKQQVKPAPKKGGQNSGDLFDNFSPMFQAKLIRPRGLVNQGNTCFMNAILQPLVHCVPFYNFIKRVGSEVKHSFTSKTPLLDSVIQFLNEFLEEEPDQKLEMPINDEFSPDYVYDALRKLHKISTIKGRQEDAEEFLGFLIQGLHEELVVLRKQVTNGSSANALKTEEDGAWLEVGKKNKTAVSRTTEIEDSPIARLFNGRMRSVVRCPGSKDSVTTEPFQALQLDIAPENVHTIEDALMNLTRPEVLEGFQSPLRGKGQATKQNYLDSLPPVLILHLKRFVYDRDSDTITKVHKHVGYSTTLKIHPGEEGVEACSPTKFMDGSIIAQPGHPVADIMSPQAKAGSRYLEYQLFAVVYHHGRWAGGGHYTCNVQRQSGEWLHFDDTTISIRNVGDVLAEQKDRHPYMLFFCKN